MQQWSEVFSVNRQIEVENMKESTYSAQHLVCDHLRSVGGIDNFVVNKALLQSASSARQRYIFHLEEQKKLKGAEKLNMKRKLSDEIDELKKKRARLHKDASAMEQSADDLALKAESVGNLTFIAQSNSLRKSAKTKCEETLFLTLFNP